MGIDRQIAVACLLKSVVDDAVRTSDVTMPPGITVRKCFGCERQVCVSPSSLSVLARNGVALCFDCVRKLAEIKPTFLLGMTPEQVEELKGWRRADAERN